MWYAVFSDTLYDRPTASVSGRCTLLFYFLLFLTCWRYAMLWLYGRRCMCDNRPRAKAAALSVVYSPLAPYVRKGQRKFVCSIETHLPGSTPLFFCSSM